MGGLGNQLFQVAASWHLQMTRDLSTRCDVSWYSGARPDGDAARELEILPLLLDDERVLIHPVLARMFYSHRNPRCFIEKGLEDDVVGRMTVPSGWVQGYFQKAEYALSVQDRLIERLLPVLDRISPSPGVEGALGVHIRLGDYFANPATRSHHGVTEPGYFERAIKETVDSGFNAPIVVFTDSPEVVKSQYLPRLPDGVQVIHARTAWETLRDLSACAGIVMSNSSLSWWSAVVASALRDRDVMVIKPVPWFAKPTAADQLLMVPGWTERLRFVVEP
jgi:hypothetical protein